MPGQSPKLLDQVRQTIRRKHYTLRIEEDHVTWLKQSMRFHHGRPHHQEVATPESAACLNHRANA